MFSDLHIADDLTTLVLLGLLVLFIGLPSAVLALRKAARPPLGAGSFRWLYLAWASILGAASVWSLSRNVLLSADEAGANNFVRLGFLLLGGLIVFLVGAKYRFFFVRELASGVLGIFSVFALWGLASTLWSVSPVGTLYKAIEYGIMLALFALVASSIMSTFKDPQDRLLALKSIFEWHWFLLCLLITSVYVGVLVLPEYAILRDYRDQSGLLGFSIQGALPGLSANAVGTVGAIMGVVAFVRMLLRPRAKLFYAAILAISVLTMVLTQSRSPILAFLLSVIAVLLMSRRIGVLIALGASAVVALSLGGQSLYEFMMRGQNEQNLTQLTGRVGRWEASFEAIQERWITGYGANVGGRFVMEAAQGEAVTDVHNSFVEVLLDTGVVGLLLLVAGLLATWFLLFRVRHHVVDNPIGNLLWLETLGVLGVLSVRSMFAVTLVWNWYVINFGIVLVFVSVVRRQVGKARPAGTAPAQPLSAGRGRRPSIRS